MCLKYRSNHRFSIGFVKYFRHEGRLCSSTCERLSVERMRESIEEGRPGTNSLFKKEGGGRGKEKRKRK